MNIKIPLLVIWEYNKRNKGLILAAFILIIVFIFLQLKFHLFFARNVIKVGLIGTYQEHDLPKEVMNLISSGLVEASSGGRFKPNLVTGWEVNHDATEFKFKLKNNLVWADKTRIKSKDLDFAIPNTSVSYPDDNTIQFNLAEPYSPLPSLLTKPVVKRDTLSGIGPYRISRIEKSRIFITKITLQSDNPKLPVIFVRFYPNEKTAVTGFHLGEIQVLMGLSNPGSLASNSLIVLKTANDYTKIVTVLFQTTDPLLRSRSLRQALAYQTPQIIGFEEANNPYPADSWAFNSEAKKYLANSKEASTALERAAAQMSDAQMHAEIILTTTPGLNEIGKQITESWKQLGFDAKIRVESGIPQNFQALLITQSIPVDPDQYFLWHATQTKTNLTKYDSKRVDKDLEDGRKIITEDERKAKYFDFQKTLLEDTPAVFLFFPKYNIVYLKKVENLLGEVLNLGSK